MSEVDEALVDGRGRNCLLTVIKRYNEAPIDSYGKWQVCVVYFADTNK